MTGDEMTDTQRYTVVPCAACFMPFAITVDFEKKRRRDHIGFFCPMGHSNYFPQQTEEERLRALADARTVELGRLRAELERCEQLRQRKKRK